MGIVLNSKQVLSTNAYESKENVVFFRNVYIFPKVAFHVSTEQNFVKPMFGQFIKRYVCTL